MINILILVPIKIIYLSCDSGLWKQFFEVKDEKEENYFKETDLNIFTIDYNRVLNQEFSLKKNQKDSKNV